MTFKSILLAVLGIGFMISCSEDPVPTESWCNSLETKEDAEEIINLCRENSYDSPEDILDNLRGDWVLLGIQNGWTLEVEPEACIMLNIGENLIKVNDLMNNQITYVPWELISYDIRDKTYYYIESNDDEFRFIVGMHCFSEDYMFGSGRTDDGFTYIYRKI